MLSTAPGPDGIPYPFWKELAKRVDSWNESHPDTTIPSFWETFTDLANWLAKHGTNSFGFKDANISLFFKKGDPTLVSNYRPISSMNTDCKLYTNLINMHLSPWAESKLHLDQKGFVPNRLITEHTCLASEVFHLTNRTDLDSYLISLDQSKVYDQVDQTLLQRTMARMGLPPGLLKLISDILLWPCSRVRINSGYSKWFSLRRGVRQGDPLSCLLYDFSIEPLGMRLRNALSGISIDRLLPAKLLMYADDTNIFANATENLAKIKTVLDLTSLALGSQFNDEKTIIKPMGSPAFRHATHSISNANTQAFPNATILPPDESVRVLGVWIGSTDQASTRWDQISTHVTKIIRQWHAIGASARNRVLLAKALMQSRCYYLLDSNSIPPLKLKKISRAIQRFVRGPNSCMPYSSLAPPSPSEG
jgi:Reverse transcriptase (RNA-dependent DNA polymerase)